MALHVILDLETQSESTVQALQELKKKQIIQAITQDGHVIIARYTVNIVTLRRILKDHLFCKS